MSNDSGWIGVDLDGTLAYYDHWRGIDHIGDPIPEMLQRVKTWLAEGRRVKIFTARVSRELMKMDDPADIEEARRARRVIRNYLEAIGIGGLEITCVKDFGMIELWDDRCVRVIPNTGMPG